MSSNRKRHSRRKGARVAKSIGPPAGLSSQQPTKPGEDKIHSSQQADSDALRTEEGSKSRLSDRAPQIGLLIAASLLGLVVLASLRTFLKPRSEAGNPQEHRAQMPKATPPNVAMMPAKDPSPQAALSNIDAAAQSLNLGTELLAEGKIDAAVAQYKEALRLNADDEVARYNLALALAKLGDRHAAEEQYREALRIYPDDAEAHNNLGNLLAVDGKLEEAMTHLEAAVRLAPSDATAHNNLGNALARQRRLPEAIPRFREAIRLKPDYFEAHYNLGAARLLQRDLDEAIAELEAALRLKPDSEPAIRELNKARSARATNAPAGGPSGRAE